MLMLRARMTELILLAVLVVGVSCKSDEDKAPDPEKPKVQVVLNDEKKNELGKFGVKGGIIIPTDEEDISLLSERDPDVQVENLAMRIRQKRYIVARPAETLRMYSDWSGISPEELRLLNDNQLPQFGERYVLSLTATEYSDFERRREEYWKEKKNEFYDNWHVKAIEYRVGKGDTLIGISNQFKVPLWFFVAHNEALDPRHLNPGDILIVPKLVEKKDVDEAMAAVEEGDGFPGETQEVFEIKVMSGETVGALAKWAQISIEDIKRVNRDLDVDHIRVGQIIKLAITAQQFEEFQKKRKKGR